jgi:putative glutamine amidotransferase
VASIRSDRGARSAVVGVLCCNRDLDGRAAQTVASRFVQPLALYSGVTVLLVPAIPDAVDVVGFSHLLDGLLLTGACSNLEPGRYGGSALPEGQGTDIARDDVALRLASRMIEAGKPVFGICRGLQELNVLFGGTLSPDVGLDGHYRSGIDDLSDALFDHHHAIEIVGSGPLTGALGRGRRRVNSVHQQGIDRLGRGLAVEAVAPDDGLVEAVWAKPCDAPVVGVQWHPEWDVATNGDSQAFFRLFGRAAGTAALR